jgi:hypothetical protein
LLEAQYALDHLCWAYRSESDRAPSTDFAPSAVCLPEFSARTAAVIRNVLDEDNRRRGPRHVFRPPGESDRSLADALLARRQAHSTTADRTHSSDLSIPTTPFAIDDGEPLTPDAVSPSRMPLRRLKP